MVTHKFKNLKNYDKLLDLEKGDLIEKKKKLFNNKFIFNR